MKYKNAAEVLPKELLHAIQKYAEGELLYIPKEQAQLKWGESSGSRNYYDERNHNIKCQYKNGKSMLQLSAEYGLAFDTVRKIIYS